MTAYPARPRVSSDILLPFIWSNVVWVDRHPMNHIMHVVPATTSPKSIIFALEGVANFILRSKENGNNMGVCRWSPGRNLHQITRKFRVRRTCRLWRKEGPGIGILSNRVGCARKGLLLFLTTVDVVKSKSRARNDFEPNNDLVGESVPNIAVAVAFIFRASVPVDRTPGLNMISNLQENWSVETKKRDKEAK